MVNKKKITQQEIDANFKMLADIDNEINNNFKNENGYKITRQSQDKIKSVTR